MSLFTIRRLTILIFLALFVCGNQIVAYAYQWATRAEEPPFTIELPEDWVSEYITKKNGVITTFSYRTARIEVRSFISEKEYTIQELVNLKAARLSAGYKRIKMAYSKESNMRSGLHLAAWELSKNGTDYYEETGFYIFDKGVITVSCMAPRHNFANYRVVFDNAFFSLKAEAEPISDPVSVDKNKPKQKKTFADLKTKFIYNFPNNFKAATIGDLQAKPEKGQPKKELKVIEDTFLPPVR